MLSELLSRYWWVLLLRGLLAILFGILAFAWPGVTLASLVLLFGVYALVDGVSAVVSALGRRGEQEHWWVLLLEGLVGIGAGLLTLFAPGVTAVVLLLYVAVWAIATGVLEIVAAIRLRKEIEGEWLMALSGVASVVFGVLLMARPGAGALAVLWLIGAYALVFGVLLVALSFRVRRLGTEQPALRTPGRPA
jgi:uncharacterized membrane protein HdeD (DUF308 family)